MDDVRPVGAYRVTGICCGSDPSVGTSQKMSELDVVSERLLAVIRGGLNGRPGWFALGDSPSFVVIVCSAQALRKYLTPAWWAAPTTPDEIAVIAGARDLLRIAARTCDQLSVGQI